MSGDKSQTAARRNKLLRRICDSLVDGLNERAEMMERGEITMLSAPTALRQFAVDLKDGLAEMESEETNDEQIHG